MSHQVKRAGLELTARVIAPPPRVSIIEWAARNVVIPEGPCPGAFRDRPEYAFFREPLERCQLPRSGTVFRRLVMPKGSRVGITTTFALIVGLYYALQQKMPAFVVAPRERDAWEFARTKLKAIIDASPRLRAAFGRQNSARALMSQEGIAFRTLYSSSKDEITSFGGAFCALDEYCRLVGTSDPGEWNTAALAERRMSEYRRKIRIDLGTPEYTEKGIMARYAESSMGRYVMPCPHCGEEQSIEFPGHPTPGSVPPYDAEQPGNLEWTGDLRSGVAAWFRCRLCLVEWTDAERVVAVSRGRWVHAQPERKTLGYHISSLYTAPMTAEEVVEAFLRGLESERDAREFYNQILGLGYESKGALVSADAIRERVAPLIAWGQPPAGTSLLTAGVDIQGTVQPWTYVYALRAWAHGKANVIEWGELHGRAAVASLLRGKRKGIKITRALIDAGGNGKHAAIKLSEEVPCLEPAIFGDPKASVELWKPGKAVKDEGTADLPVAKWWMVNRSLMLDQVFVERMQRPPGAAGGIIFAGPPEGEEERLDQLVYQMTGLSRETAYTRAGEEVLVYRKTRELDVDLPFSIGLAEVAALMVAKKAPPVRAMGIKQPKARAGATARRTMRRKIAQRRRTMG